MGPLAPATVSIMANDDPTEKAFPTTSESPPPSHGPRPAIRMSPHLASNTVSVCYTYTLHVPLRRFSLLCRPSSLPILPGKERLGCGSKCYSRRELSLSVLQVQRGQAPVVICEVQRVKPYVYMRRGVNSHSRWGELLGQAGEHEHERGSSNIRSGSWSGAS